MIFEIPYWKDRLQAAITQEDFSQLLKDMQDNPTDMTSRNGRQSSNMEQYPYSAPLILNSRKGKIMVC